MANQLFFFRAVCDIINFLLSHAYKYHANLSFHHWMNAQDWCEKSREPNIEKEARNSMIKYMLVIVVLMQSSRGEDRYIREELITSLEELIKELIKKPANWSIVSTLSFPFGLPILTHMCCHSSERLTLSGTLHIRPVDTNKMLCFCNHLPFSRQYIYYLSIFIYTVYLKWLYFLPAQKF